MTNRIRVKPTISRGSRPAKPAASARRRARQGYRLGIDLGGTKMHAVVIDGDGRLLAVQRQATKVEGGYHQVLMRLRDLANAVVAESGVTWSAVRTVGLGMPGPIDEARGRVVVAPNLGWRDKPVARDLSALLRRPVVLGNDANCGGLAEATYGAARGASSAAALFVGTGLGGALIIDGRIVNGRHGFAGEIGHVRAPFGQARCSCGMRGCLETVASKKGIARHIDEFIAEGMRSRIERSTGQLRSSELRRAWKAGCPATCKAVALAARGLAWGLATFAGTFDPEVFILGGGVVEALAKPLLPLVREELVQTSLLYGPQPGTPPRRAGKQAAGRRGAAGMRRKMLKDLRSTVTRAALGDDAVAIGAAILSRGGQP